VEKAARTELAEGATRSAALATAMPDADPPPAAPQEPPSLASEIARRRLGERLRRLASFFAGTRRGFVSCRSPSSA